MFKSTKNIKYEINSNKLKIENNEVIIRHYKYVSEIGVDVD